MKKFLTILFFLQILASGKDVRIFLNSNVDANISFKTSPVSTKINYTPIDLTVASRDNRFRANFVLKGRANDNKKFNLISTVDNKELLFDNNLPKIKNIKKTVEFFDHFTDEFIKQDQQFEEIYGILFESSYNLNLNNQTNANIKLNELDKHLINSFIYKDNIQYQRTDPFSGNSGHDHGHNHDHNHTDDHNHEHSFKRETFKTLNPRYFTTKTNSSLVQAKIDLKYFNGKNGIRYIQYLTPFEEEDGVKQKGDAILELRNINVFKDKFSIAFTPRIYTRNFIKPLYFDLDFDARYKKDENTTLGLFYYTATQLDDLKHFKNTKNKVSIYYDFKEDYRKFHKFYEILDHEHESKNRFRIFASFNKEKKIFNGIFNNIDVIKEKEEKTLELNVKKSDFLIKNLSFKNDLKIQHELQTTKSLENKYLFSVNRKLENKAFESVISEYDSIIKTNSNKSNQFSNFNSKVVGIYKEKDKLHLHYLKSVDFNDIPIKYLDIFTFKDSFNNNYIINTDTNILKIDNTTKLDYKMKKANISLENNISLINDLSFFEKYVLKDKITLAYKTEERNNLLLDLKLSNDYTFTSLNNILKYSINTLTFDGTLGYTFRFQTFNITPYTGIKHDIQFRKAYHEALLKNPLELNKTIVGHLITLNHGIKTSIDFNNHLSLTGDINVKYYFDKQSIKNADNSKFSSIAPNFSKFSPDVSIKFGLKYVY